MENYELLTQGQHVDEGKLSGPVVNSPRQLWSVAAYFAVVTEGVFGLTADDRVEPKLPTSLVPMLFGTRTSITLNLRDRRITLQLPASPEGWSSNGGKHDGNLLVADRTVMRGTTTTVLLKAVSVQQTPLRTDAPLYAPSAPAAPVVQADGNGWHVQVDGNAVLYLDSHRQGGIDGTAHLARQPGLTCISATRMDAHGLESLHSPDTCVGDMAKVGGAWPRVWTASAAGSYRVALDYANNHGPINTGVTAAVKMLAVRCDGSDVQRMPIVMPHSVGVQRSTYGSFAAKAGALCHFALDDGFNMSYLAHFAHFNGGAGGSEGRLNSADVRELVIAPLVPQNTPIRGSTP
jgi:hypothetical protein